MQEMNTFVQLIKNEMINRGWVNHKGKLINKKLADTSGVNPGTVSRFLNNKSVNMKLDNLYQMLSALDLIRDNANGNRGEHTPPETKEEKGLPVEYQNQDRETREMIEDLLFVMRHGNTDMKNAVRMGIKGVLAAIDKEAAANEQQLLIKELQENYRAIIKRLDLLAGPAETRNNRKSDT